jgi:hypothetical protein
MNAPRAIGNGDETLVLGERAGRTGADGRTHRYSASRDLAPANVRTMIAKIAPAGIQPVQPVVPCSLAVIA